MLNCSRESILESQYTQRLRESISHQGKYDVSDHVAINRDSLDDLEQYHMSNNQESSFERALQWQVNQPRGLYVLSSLFISSRHTVNVGSTMREPLKPFQAFPPLHKPVTEHSSTSHFDRMATELNTVNEISYCERMNTLHIDKFAYDTISEVSFSNVFYL